MLRAVLISSPRSSFPNSSGEVCNSKQRMQCVHAVCHVRCWGGRQQQQRLPAPPQAARHGVWDMIKVKTDSFTQVQPCACCKFGCTHLQQLILCPQPWQLHGPVGAVHD